MSMRLVLASAASLCLAVPPAVSGAVDRPLVDAADSRGAVRLVGARRAATIAVDADVDPAVRRAATALAEDAVRVTGVRPALTTGAAVGSDIVVVGVTVSAGPWPASTAPSGHRRVIV